MGLGDDFLRFDTKNSNNESKNKETIKLKICCTVEVTINKMKRQYAEWEKIFSFKKIGWSIVDLQCCVSFRCVLQLFI